jgi:hypothetical protein
VVEFLCPLRRKALKGSRMRLIRSKVVTEVRKTNSKTTTLHPLYPKLSTSTLTLHFLLENLSLKITKPKTKLKIFQRKITKESKNNYSHYHYL